MWTVAIIRRIMHQDEEAEKLTRELPISFTSFEFGHGENIFNYYYFCLLFAGA